MISSYKYFALLLCLVTGYANAQNSYLLNYEHKAKGGSENTYFYLEPLGASLPPGLPEAKVVTLNGTPYRINYMQLREDAPSRYVGCSQYGSQARGEELSVNRLLTDSVLRVYSERQRAIEDECNSLFSNKGRQNSMLTVELNGGDKLKLTKIEMEYCSCITGREQFSHLSDSLVMPRKVVKADVFTDEEKNIWENQLSGILQNDFVKSCLPVRDRDFRSYQAIRE